MQKFNIKLSAGDSLNLTIPISTNIKPVTTQEGLNDTWVENEISKFIPDTLDYEVSRYTSGLQQIIFNLLQPDDTFYTLEDFGFDSNDIKFFTNRLFNSALQLRYYNKSDLNNRQLLYSATIPFQRIILYEQSVLKPIDQTDISFIVNNPKINRGFNENFNIFIPKFLLNELNGQIFVSFRFLNALNGNAYVLYAKKGINNIGLLNEFDNIKILLNSDNTYTYVNTDRSLLTTIDNKLIVNLYENNI